LQRKGWIGFGRLDVLNRYAKERRGVFIIVVPKNPNAPAIAKSIESLKGFVYPQ